MSEKQDLFDSQHGLCWLCDKPMTMKTATYDHLLPVSKGGRWFAHNLKLAHGSCNMIRSSHDFLTAREYVREATRAIVSRPYNRKGILPIYRRLIADGVIEDPNCWNDDLIGELAELLNLPAPTMESWIRERFRQEGVIAS